MGAHAGKRSCAHWSIVCRHSPEVDFEPPAECNDAYSLSLAVFIFPVVFQMFRTGTTFRPQIVTWLFVSPCMLTSSVRACAHLLPSPAPDNLRVWHWETA